MFYKFITNKVYGDIPNQFEFVEKNIDLKFRQKINFTLMDLTNL